jgi:uncharacterized protein YqeY
MSIQEDLKKRLVAAMKERDTRTADVVKMLRSKVQERTKSKGFKGEVDDALHLEVIASYKKQMEKAKVQFEEAGERGAENAAQAQFEIDFCAQFLPKELDDDATRELVRAAIDELGISDPKQAGRVVGAVMKTHRGQVNAGKVKQMATELLSA